MRERWSGFTRGLLLSLVIGGFMMVTGCGTTAVVHKPADNKSVFDFYRTLAIQSAVADGVVLPDHAQERIQNLVKANISAKYCPKRFQSITTKEVGKDDLVLLIKYTTYDEGNRFARFMLAGLGGMKIHSDVIVKNAASDEPISHAEVGKTFRWGGIYGATTDISEIEKWFAEEIGKTFAGIIGIEVPE
jgi:hypothetical protein